MNPQDDPEARIRDLERPLADAARASELGSGQETGYVSPPPTQPWTYGNTFPPPPPGPPAPWPGYADQYPEPPQPHKGSGARILIVLVAVFAFLLAAGIAAYVMFAGTGSTGGTIATETDTETTTRSSRTIQTPTALPPQITTDTTTVIAPGETVVVSGIEENRTIECDGNAVTVSGIENTVEITGHCANLTVSGIQNTITVDSADTIGVSGFENRITYHTGQPQIANSGMSNTVDQG